MRILDSSNMPNECGPVFFSGNTDIFQVPDKCCTAEVGAEDWIPFEEFGSYEGIDGCYPLDPFENGAIKAGILEVERVGLLLRYVVHLLNVVF